jgi:GT2 family glycosyltransferase
MPGLPVRKGDASRHEMPLIRDHSQAENRVDLSVILINWRMRKDLESCLRCIEHHRSDCTVEVILINKPSEDGTERMIAETFPWVRLFSHDRFGFATMRNVGLRNARGRHCLVLDTDTELLSNCFDALVNFMDRHPRLAGCGGHTTRLDGEIEYNVKRFYDLMTVMVRRTWIHDVWPNNPWNRRHLMVDKNHNRPFEGDWMAGACFCIRRETLEEVGYFDESMHYFEDVDWCWRAKQAGWRIAFNPYARIVHKVQRLSGGGFSSNTLLHLRSGLRFWWKAHHMGLDWAWAERPERIRRRENDVLSEVDTDRSRPDLSVVVINMNGRKLLEDCLVSLRDAAPRHRLEVLVVDNGSTDGSPEMVRKQFPEVKLTVNKQNLGFTKANNQGIHPSSGRYVMLLNNDTRVVPGAFSVAIDYLDQNAAIGCAGLQLLNEDASLQLSCRRFPSFSQALFNRYSLLTRLFPNNRISRAYLMTDAKHDEIQDVDWVSGACLMFRRSVLQEIGALDERFFMYSEDVDYCFRVWQAGWRVTYLPFAQVFHLIGQDTKKVRFKLTYERHKSMYKFYKKHYSRHLMFLDLVTSIMVAVRCATQLSIAGVQSGLAKLQGGRS